MITEQDLMAAIAECEGSRNPNASTCVKLAAFYAILDHMQNKPSLPVMNGYSFASERESDIQYSDSEFSGIVREKGISKCYPILDELMNVLYVVNQPLYENAMRKLKGI